MPILNLFGRYGIAAIVGLALGATALTGFPHSSLADDGEAEILFWESVKDSGDPAEFEAYLESFPDGRFAPLARVRAEKLRAAEDAEAPATAQNPTPPPDGAPAEDRPQSVAEPEQPPAVPEEIKAAKIDTSDWEMPELTEPDRPVVGIEIQNLTNQDEKRLGVGSDFGVLVIGLSEVGTARDSDIEKDDIVRAVNGEATPTGQILIDKIKAVGSDASLTLRVWRNGVERDVALTTRDYAKSHFAAAKEGSPESIAAIAYMYERGFLTGKDDAKARLWRMRAAEAGHAESMGRTGLYYLNGTAGADKDLDEAKKWFEKGAELENALSLFNLGRLYHYAEGHEHDLTRAAAYYQRAADLDHPGSMTNLAVLYGKGERVEKDEERQAKLLQRAVELGQTEAFVNLGLAYQSGQGVERDLNRALELFEQAANKGMKEGWRYLGNVYWNGQNLVTDREKAAAYYRRAVAMGDTVALETLKENGLAPYDVALIQRLLAEFGLDPGPVDGKMGGKTRAAIRQFEEGLKLKPTGQPSLELQRKLQEERTAQLTSPKPATQQDDGSAPPAPQTTRNPELDKLEQLD